MKRTYDPEKIRTALALYPFNPVELDVEEWVSNELNLAFEAEDGSIALFEYLSPGLYDGHYFFLCRGRDARDLAKVTLELIHKEYGAKVIRGFTPVQHKAALWMSRHLGFKDMGIVPTREGDCVLFVMNLDEHYKGTN